MLSAPLIITAGLVVAIAFNLVKPYVELAVPLAGKDGHPNPLHDSTLRLVVLLIGVIVGLCDFALTQQAWTWHVAAVAAIDGAKVGLVAIIAYHLVPGDFLPSVTTPTPPPAPEAPAPVVAPVQQHIVTIQQTPAPPPLTIDDQLRQTTAGG